MKKPAAFTPTRKRPAAEAEGADEQNQDAGDSESEHSEDGENFELGKDGGKLRDPAKAKKFMLALHSNQVPATVKTAYDAALVKRGSNMRSSITEIINRFYKRNRNGKLACVPDHSAQGFQDEVHAGMIWEEAVTKVGGEEFGICCTRQADSCVRER